ncbi:metal-sulfur cluster assembly factor [Euzebya sp.]|uniref:metal-sulfur cluster assembly factor n=1 Tax=Euzebya sp. TaxID=1971409 RepID=UPI003518CBF6
MRDDPSDPATEVGRAVHTALTAVIDPCCKDRGISVVDMGLVSDVTVDATGHARVEIVLTSGWCPFQVDLTEEITAAAEQVAGVGSAEVAITLDQVWSPDRMAPAARRSLRLLPDPGEVADRDAYLSGHPAARPLPIATARGAAP